VGGSSDRFSDFHQNASLLFGGPAHIVLLVRVDHQLPLSIIFVGKYGFSLPTTSVERTTILIFVNVF
jgi:hypothetical protein